MLGRTLMPVAVFALAAAAAQRPSADNPFTEIRQKLVARDYSQAALAAAQLRQVIAASRSATAILSVSAKPSGPADLSAALAHIDRAEVAYHAGDLDTAVHSLDLARAAAAALYADAPPGARLASAERELADESAAGEPGVRALEQAAAEAYAAGDYDESIGFARRAINAAVAYPNQFGWFLHQAHTILGLDYAALADPNRAAAELAASARVPPDPAFKRYGPNTDLARRLKDIRPDAVAAYLGAWGLSGLD